VVFPSAPWRTAFEECLDAGAERTALAESFRKRAPNVDPWTWKRAVEKSFGLAHSNGSGKPIDHGPAAPDSKGARQAEGLLALQASVRRILDRIERGEPVSPREEDFLKGAAGAMANARAYLAAVAPERLQSIPLDPVIPTRPTVPAATP